MKPLYLSLLILLLGTSVLQAEVIYAAELNARELPMGNMLSWNTLFEENNKLFIVERSTDGVEFANIGMVDSKFGTEETPYRFMDTNFPDQRSYYRLKEVDLDGTSSFSHTIIVDKKMENQFAVVRIRQAEVTTLLEWTVDARVAERLEIKLTDYQGNLLETQEQTTIDGLNDFAFDLSGREEGLYRVTMQMGAETEQIVLRRVTGEADRKPAQASKD